MSETENGVPKEGTLSEESTGSKTLLGGFSAVASPETTAVRDSSAEQAGAKLAAPGSADAKALAQVIKATLSRNSKVDTDVDPDLSHHQSGAPKWVAPVALSLVMAGAVSIGALALYNFLTKPTSTSTPAPSNSSTSRSTFDIPTIPGTPSFSSTPVVLTASPITSVVPTSSAMPSVVIPPIAIPKRSPSPSATPSTSTRIVDPRIGF